MIHHVAMHDKMAGEVDEARAKGHAAISGHHHRVMPVPLGDRLAVDRHHLEGVGVDVEDMLVFMLVDDDPFLDGAERNALIGAGGIEAPAADVVGEFLVVGGGREFRLVDGKRDAALVGNLAVGDGNERRLPQRRGNRTAPR